MNLCVNCVYLRQHDLVCVRPVGISVVTGLTLYRNVYAVDERRDKTGCAMNASYYVQRPPAAPSRWSILWRRIWEWKL